MQEFLQWERDVEQRGLDKGLEKGLEQGERKVVLRLLERRFGPLDEQTRAQLDAASAEQLERLADRVLSAATLSEVFAN